MYDLEREATGMATGALTRMQFLRRGLAAGVSATVLGQVLAACGGSTNAADPKTATGATPVNGTAPKVPTGTLTIGDVQVPRATNWDAASSIGGYDARVFSLMYEPLIDITPDGKLVPLLAKSYTRIDDRTLRVVIRDDVTFHDGSPLSVQDVKATLDRLGDPKSTVPLASAVTPLHVKVVDNTTVDIITDQPFPLLERVLVPIKIMSAKDLASPRLLKQRANGTGPFKLVRKSSQATVMEANESYWVPGRPHIKQIEYRTITDQSARVGALQTGAIDLLTEAGPAQIAQFSRNGKFYVPPQKYYTGAQFIYLLNQTGKLADIKLRQAVAYAVDRQAIAKSILRGTDPVASSPLPTTDPFYTPLKPEFAYDPEKAKSLVQQAGNVPTLRMASSSVWQFAPEADQAVAKYLNAAGLKVKIDRVDPGTYAGGVYSKYDISLNALVEFTPSDPDYLFGFYRVPLDKIVLGNHDPKMAKLATDQRFLAGEERKTAVTDASQYIWEQQPMLYLADNYFPDILTKRVSNYTPTPSFGLVGLKEAWVS